MQKYPGNKKAKPLTANADKNSKTVPMSLIKLAPNNKNIRSEVVQVK